MAFINAFPSIIPNIKVQCKKILAIFPLPKFLNPRLDYNTVLQLQIFLEILDNYRFFMILKIHPTHAKWTYLIVLHNIEFFVKSNLHNVFMRIHIVENDIKLK